MATREIAHITGVLGSECILPVSSNATQTTPAIDTKGWQSIEFLFVFGAWTAGNFTPSLLECATLGGTYTAVDPTTIEWWINEVAQGLGNAPVVLSAANQNSVIACSYTGNMRYLKGVITPSNTPTAILQAIIPLHGHPRESI